MPDTLELPIFDEPYGRLLSACAELTTSKRSVLGRLAKATREPLTARIGKGSATEYVTLLGGGGGKHATKKHLHVDVATASYFAVPPKPQKVIGSERLGEIVSDFFGQPATVNVTARFTIPFSELPKNDLIRNSLTEVKEKDYFMRQDSATFVIGNESQSTELWFR